MIRMVAGRTPAALTAFLSAEPLPGDDEATSTEPRAGSDAPGHPRSYEDDPEYQKYVVEFHARFHAAQRQMGYFRPCPICEPDSVLAVQMARVINNGFKEGYPECCIYQFAQDMLLFEGTFFPGGFFRGGPHTERGPEYVYCYSCEEPRIVRREKQRGMFFINGKVC